VTLFVVALQLLVLASTLPTQGAAQNVQGDPSTVACTFENPKFAGQCVENVTPDENQSPVQACNVVLSCLNNPRCVKIYCNATTLRAGWTLVSAQPVDQ